MQPGFNQRTPGFDLAGDRAVGQIARRLQRDECGLWRLAVSRLERRLQFAQCRRIHPITPSSVTTSFIASEAKQSRDDWLARSRLLRRFAPRNDILFGNPDKLGAAERKGTPMGPLEGVKIVELARIGPGPFCAIL